jgi:hypothetical protein
VQERDATVLKTSKKKVSTSYRKRRLITYQDLLGLIWMGIARVDIVRIKGSKYSTSVAVQEMSWCRLLLRVAEIL